MEKNKSNHLAARILCGILTAFGIVASVISLVGGGNGIWTVNDGATLIVSLFVGYYIFIGYRKPHGNLLKYIILLSTADYFIAVYQLARLSNPWLVTTGAIKIGLCFYVAGRLHRIKQNIFLMSIVVAVRLVEIIVSLADGIMTVGGFAHLTILIDILVAYVLRYKEHKEAGVIDAEL